jgi:hypothetical protein
MSVDRNLPFSFVNTTAPKWPTLAEVVADFKTKVHPGQELFYSYERSDSEPEPEAAHAYALKHGLKTVWDHMDPVLRKSEDVEKRLEYFEHASAAYGQVVTGKVYVLMDGAPSKGKSWLESTIWDSIEWPEIEKRSGVEVYRVNPTTAPENGFKIK